MKKTTDMHLWEWFKRKISPINSPYRIATEVEQRQSWTLDLHGITIQDAYSMTRQHIASARKAGCRSCLIITGKSGEIQREFPFWMDDCADVSACTSTNGDGAFQVLIRRA